MPEPKVIGDSLGIVGARHHPVTETAASSKGQGGQARGAAVNWEQKGGRRAQA